MATKTTKKKKNQSGGDGQQATKTLTVSDRRMMELLGRIDQTLGEARVTTTEMILCARQMLLSGTAQLCEDNPQADALQLVADITADLRQALTARVLRQPGAPAFGTVGRA